MPSIAYTINPLKSLISQPAAFVVDVSLIPIVSLVKIYV